MKKKSIMAVTFGMSLYLCACGAGNGGQASQGTVAESLTDNAGADENISKEESTKTESRETGSRETGSRETGSRETESGETESGKTGAGEMESGEAESGKMESGETESGKTGSGEAKSGKTGSGETESGETGSIKTGSAEAGSSKVESFGAAGTDQEKENSRSQVQEGKSESGSGNNTELINPIKQVDSSADFKTIGLNLSLPEDKERYENITYSIISNEIAQIRFHDKTTNSDAILRAGKAEGGDPSGIYYEFDSSKVRKETVKAKDGTEVDIVAQPTIENSDIHGVLVVWNAEGSVYTLWEDDAREQIDEVVQAAVEIAKTNF